jgi:hypothetical protein
VRTVYKQNSNHKGEEGAEGKGKEGFSLKNLIRLIRLRGKKILTVRIWAVTPFVKALENKQSAEITLRLNSYRGIFV